MAVVEENHRAMVHFPRGNPDNRLRPILPVKSRHRPHDQLESSLPEDRHQSEPSPPIGWAEQSRTHSGNPLDRFLGPVDFLSNELPASREEKRVRIRMVADRVPFAHDAPGDFRMALDILAAEKERCGNLVFGKDVEDLFRKWWRRAIIEGQHGTLARRRAMDQCGAK